MALFQGGSPPAELNDFLTATVFWQRLGVSEAELEDWPEEKVRHYLQIIDQVSLWERKEQAVAEHRAQTARKRR